MVHPGSDEAMVGRDPDERATAAPRVSPGEAVFVLRTADHLFAVTASSVEHVDTYQAPVRVPGAPPFLLGVVRTQGRVVGVLDLRTLLRLPAAASGSPQQPARTAAPRRSRPRLVVLRVKALLYALVADVTLGLRAIDPATIDRASCEAGSPIQGRVALPEGLTTILDPERIPECLAPQGVSGSGE